MDRGGLASAMCRAIRGDDVGMHRSPSFAERWNGGFATPGVEHDSMVENVVDDRVMCDDECRLVTDADRVEAGGVLR